MTAAWLDGESNATVTAAEEPAFHSAPRCGCGAPLDDAEDVLCEACHCARREPAADAPPPPVGGYRLDDRRLRAWYVSAEARLGEAGQLEARARQLRLDVANEMHAHLCAATDCPGVLVLGQLVAMAVRP